MKRYGVAALSAAILALGGCNESGDTVERVQTNLVDKSVFEGEWWYSSSVVDTDFDETFAIGGFSGSMQFIDLGLDATGTTFTMARIRWVVDQNYLYAYRSYELIDGGNEDGRSPDFRGQPLAAFAIQDHVDVRQDYNPSTGELTNVRVENASDRRWYQRQFVRVDWSQNVISPFYAGDHEFSQLAGYYEPLSVPFFFEDGAHGDFPASYAPKFVRVKDDPSYRFAAEWPATESDKVHFMSFVTQQVWSPGAGCFQYGSPCTSVAVTVRNSFLRVPPNHEYAAMTQTHAEWDRYGLFRQQASTYIRGGRDEDTLSRHCADDTDCGGGTCDATTHTCIGGLTSDYGETDYMTWYRPMHNFFSDSLTDTTCVADWQCDGRYGDAAGTAGSQCDRAAHRCSIPIAMRPLRKVAYHLSPGFPTMYVRSAYQTVSSWNEVFMQGLRAVKGNPLPTGPAQPTQDTDPTQYCFANGTLRSAEVNDGGTPMDPSDDACPYKYDPFESPDAARARGVTNPFDCHVTGAADLAHPSASTDYGADAYRYEFTGGECAFILKTNSCDLDPTAACEELGDIRYQFFNYLPHGLSAFGVAIPMSDPKNGELITSNSNIGAEFMEYQGSMALGYLPMLRGEITEEEFYENQDLRDFNERRGRVEHPPLLAASGTDGFSTSDPSRPGLPVDLTTLIRTHMDRIAPQVERLHGTQGRAMINSDRLAQLAGTEHERRLMGVMDQDVLTDLYGQDRTSRTTRVTDDHVIEHASPFRGGIENSIDRDRRQENWLSSHNYCHFDERLYGPSFYGYWAEAFRGFPNEEANLRIRQLTLRGVMLHELGHSVGLRHNFAGSYDRNNYYDGYFQIARALPMPVLDDYDANMDGSVTGDEMNRFYADQRRVRDQRNARGYGNTSSGSIMDYPGDTADWSGRLGRYDAAATMWGYFNRSEVYDGDPRLVSAGTSLDGLYQADIGQRSLWTYYRGGDACNFDNECPHTVGASTLAEGQAVAQRCVTNPRYTRDPQPCEGAADCVCSNFYEDMRDFVSGTLYSDSDGDGVPDTAAYDNDADDDREIDHLPVRYMFCSDERTDDISWCSRFDAGESFRESVDHYRREWEDNYPNSYYRRYSLNGARGRGTYAGITNGVKVFQHFFFRYFYEPAFRFDAGPIGQDDQFLASVDIMNWLAEIVGAPDVGSYELDTATNNYRFMGNDLRMAGSDATLETGQGFNMWSAYQTGLNGFFRRERAGTFSDKLFALYAFARRDWSLNFTVDERFYINFYSLFPLEVTEFFGGYIQRDPRVWAPRLDCTGPECTLQYMSLWRAGDNCGSTRDQPCRGDNASAYTGSSIDGASPDVLRQWATMLALAEFPVFYDTTFEQRLVIYKLASGDGWTRPGLRPDGAPFCEYGAAGCTDPDYVQYTSDRLHTTYVANVIRSSLYYNLPEEQIGFGLLRRLVDRQNRIRTLTALPTPTPAETEELSRSRLEQQRDDSYLELLIDIQRQYGISSYL